jgi:transcriptional regulator with XRE-family HTH domain
VPPPSLDRENWRQTITERKRTLDLSINRIAQRSGLDRSTVIELLNGRRKVKNFKNRYLMGAGMSA